MFQVASATPLPASWEEFLPMIFVGTGGKKFSFDFHSVPLSTPKEVISVLVIYLSTLAILKFWRNGKPKMSLKGVAFVHNLVLAIGSGLLLVGIASEIIPALRKDSLFEAVCGTDIFNGRLEIFFYINYLFKVWELFDTVLLVLKGSPLTFLHVYHHCLTFVLCYTQFVGQSSVQWVPITLNLIVHMFMYWYYAMASIGIYPWWKKYLTTMQIIQFVIDIGFCYFCLAVLLLGENGVIPYTCHGTRNAAIFGSLLLTSYLWLFIDFFHKTYGPSSSRAPKRKTE